MIEQNEIVSAAFHSLSDERWQQLCGDDWIEEFLDQTRYVAVKVQGELAAYNAGESMHDPDWHHRAASVFRHVQALMIWLKPKAAKVRDRRYLEQRMMLDGDRRLS